MAARTAPITLHTVVAAATVLDCSDDHVYRLISSGALRAVDISQPGSIRPKTRVRSDDLDAYIEGRTRKTTRLRSTA